MSGLSCVVYVLLRLGDESREAAVPKVDTVSGEDSYDAKLLDDSGLRYSVLLPAGALPPRIADAAGARAGGPRQSLVWTGVGPEHVLMTLPLVFALRSDEHQNAVALTGALELDQILAIVRVAMDRRELESMADKALEVLVERGVVPQGASVTCIPVISRVGMQLWDLTGSEGRDERKPFDNVRESRRYAWELAALMSHSADHVLEDGRWRERSPDSVRNDLRSGFSFLSDHMVFVNDTCCLEITHTVAAQHRRFDFRLRTYGYDSSSLFVWTIGTFRREALRNLTEHYRGEKAGYLDAEKLSARDHRALLQSYTRHEAFIDSLDGLGDALREPRNRALDRIVREFDGYDRALAGVKSEMEKTERLAADLVKVGDEEVQARTNTLIGILAVAVGTVGIPELVSHVATWLRDDRWVEIGVSAGLIVALLAALGVVFFGPRRG